MIRGTVVACDHASCAAEFRTSSTGPTAAVQLGSLGWKSRVVAGRKIWQCPDFATHVTYRVPAPSFVYVGGEGRFT